MAGIGTLKVFLVLCGLEGFAHMEEALEHLVRHTPNPRSLVHRYLLWTLPLLKWGRSVAFFIAAVEVVFFRRFTWPSFAFGIALLFLGLSLRLLAIRALGSFWVNHVAVFRGQHLVKRGIYRVIRHPGYIGNIHIPGLLLLIGAPLSAAFAFFLITIFYVIRAPVEDKLLTRFSTNSKTVKI